MLVNLHFEVYEKAPFFVEQFILGIPTEQNSNKSITETLIYQA